MPVFPEAPPPQGFPVGDGPERPGAPPGPFYAPEMFGIWTEPGRPAAAGSLAASEAPAPTAVEDEPFAVGGGAQPVPAEGPSGNHSPSPLPAPDAPPAASSPAPHLPEAPVDLEIYADVVIYGRTRPGTQVFVSGTDVPVRGDGTFELRFAMPPAPREGGRPGDLR
jgi:hypothetical protein